MHHGSCAEGPGAEGEGDFEGPGRRCFDFFQFVVGEAEGFEALVADVRGVVQGEGAHDKTEDVVDLLGGVAEVDQGGAEGLVGDLEISAAGELLEFDQGEVGLDAGGVAIHEQADGAGGGDDGGLGVAVAVCFAECQGAVPAFAGGGEQGDAGPADRRRRIARRRCRRARCRGFRSRPDACAAAALCG